MWKIYYQNGRKKGWASAFDKLTKDMYSEPPLGKWEKYHSSYIIQSLFKFEAKITSKHIQTTLWNGNIDKRQTLRDVIKS
jgi:hypothetical protein